MKKKPYPTVAVFSGGGTRYALYLGMYAAMQHYGVKPDLLIAACGGSIAANIINSFATDEQRKAFIQSEELYRFVQNTRMTRFKMLYKSRCLLPAQGAKHILCSLYRKYFR